MGGDAGFGFGKTKQRSGTSTESFVDPAQQPFLDFLRQSATGLQQSQQSKVGGLFGLAGNLGQQGQQSLGQLGGISQQLQQGQNVGFGQGQGGIDTLNQFTQGTGLGQGQLQRIAGGNDPAVGNQIGQLGQDIQRQFSQLLPGIEAQAIGGGQLGGGRQGVAQGLGLQASQDAFQRGATDIRAGDLQRQLAAAGQLGQQAGQAGGQLGQLGLQQGVAQAGLDQAGLQSAAQTELGGLGQLQNLFNLGFSPFQAEFSPLLALNQVIGQPTVLQTGESFGRTDQFNFNASFPT